MKFELFIFGLIDNCSKFTHLSLVFEVHFRHTESSKLLTKDFSSFLPDTASEKLVGSFIGRLLHFAKDRFIRQQDMHRNHNFGKLRIVDDAFVQVVAFYVCKNRAMRFFGILMGFNYHRYSSAHIVLFVLNVQGDRNAKAAAALLASLYFSLKRLIQLLLVKSPVHAETDFLQLIANIHVNFDAVLMSMV